MATFSGLHIECSSPADDFSPVAVPKIPDWSETFTTANTTTSAMARTSGEGLITLTASGSDWWASFGTSPSDPLQAATPRVLIKADDPRSFSLPLGFKVRAAPVA